MWRRVLLNRIVEKIKSWRLNRGLKSGRVLRGRQQLDKVSAKAKTRKSTISARVYRSATDEWEDLGVIARNKEK